MLYIVANNHLDVTYIFWIEPFYWFKSSGLESEVVEWELSLSGMATCSSQLHHTLQSQFLLLCSK